MTHATAAPRRRHMRKTVHMVPLPPRHVRARASPTRKPCSVANTPTPSSSAISPHTQHVFPWQGCPRPQCAPHNLAPAVGAVSDPSIPFRQVMRTRDERPSRPAQQQSRPSRVYLYANNKRSETFPIAGRTKEFSANAARGPLHRCASTPDTALTHGRCNRTAVNPPGPRLCARYLPGILHDSLCKPYHK
jgi:hypothetical protein